VITTATSDECVEFSSILLYVFMARHSYTESFQHGIRRDWGPSTAQFYGCEMERGHRLGGGGGDLTLLSPLPVQISLALRRFALRNFAHPNANSII
jgi:hypothetical protein